MTTVSEYFKLNKSQSELDFVNVELDKDAPLFLDPFALSQRSDLLSVKSHQMLTAFFQRLVDAIRADNMVYAKELLCHLQEPNETRLGLSKGRSRGAGVGNKQAEDLLKALTSSTAVKTGFLSSLQECELMIDGISRDKISDLTTNIIRKSLAEYTKQQAELLGLPTRAVALAPYYSLEHEQWISDYYQLPVVENRPLLLVPKVFVRRDPAYQHDRFYRDFVLDYLQAEALSANSSLVRMLKNGNRVVFKKDLEAKFPLSKAYLLEFSKKNPEVLKRYKKELVSLENQRNPSDVDEENQGTIASMLKTRLRDIAPGNLSAGEYHDLMIGVAEFLFFPSLLAPVKEEKIHDGRKRIDIVVQNGSREGIFYLLPTVRRMPCPFVIIECKNYTNEVGNEELDQLAGRFSPVRGKLGILFCRSFENRDRFIKRCQDTLREDRGLIIPMDDIFIEKCLTLIETGYRHNLDEEFSNLVNEVWSPAI